MAPRILAGVEKSHDQIGAGGRRGFGDVRGRAGGEPRAAGTFGGGDGCQVQPRDAGSEGERDAEDMKRLEMPRRGLHAHRYQLAHAITGEALDVVSPLAEDLTAFWRGLR